MKNTSSRPYFIRAVYEWLADNSLTPHIMVNANLPGVEVPRDFITDGKIALNISMTAVSGLELTNIAVTFQAQFKGIVENIYIPVMAVEAIYASENGQGMEFDDEDVNNDPPPSPPSDNKQNDKKKPPFLRVVE